MAAVASSSIDHDPSFGQSFKKAAAVCVRGEGGRGGGGREADKKSIGFHYVFGRCHWPVNDPVTAAAAGGRPGDTDLHSSSSSSFAAAAAADKRETS